MTVDKQRHKAVVRARVEAETGEVWRTVADLAAWPSWNRQVKEMERREAGEGEVWVMRDRNGTLPSEVVERTAPAEGRPGRLVTRIADPALPFGGTWTWEVAPEGSATVVTITEDGEIRNAFFRFMARWVFGYTGTAEKTLRCLGRRFGRDVVPEVVASGKESLLGGRS